MELRTNEDVLVEFTVLGEIYSSHGHPGMYRVQPSGEPIVVPCGWGGIRLNVSLGDPAMGWIGDHVEPGVSIKNAESNEINKGSNAGLNAMACIGNEAKIVSGEAKGKKGVVTGKHAGIEHVILDFTREIREQLIPGDTIKITAVGLGYKLLDYPDVGVMSMSPPLLKKMNITEKDGKLTVPVTHLIPAEITGSGVGYEHAYTGDIDIQMFDAPTVAKYGLEDLKMGDIVAILDWDSTFGRVYQAGALTIGVVVHGDSVMAGYGPGVTSLLATKVGKIETVIDPDANLAKMLDLL